MYAAPMAFVIRAENGNVLSTRDTFEEARRVALLNPTLNPVIEDGDGNELARVVLTPDR